METISIVILDDNVADYNLIRRSIVKGLGTKLNLELKHFLEPESCYEYLSNTSSDCLILDYLLGAQTGDEVIRKMRTLDSCPPIVVLTGEGDESIAVKVMKLGASDYLAKKDTHARAISDAILRSLEKKRMELQLLDQKRELEDFAYTVAHDIRSPLAELNQVAQMIDMHLEDSDDGELQRLSVSMMRVSKNLTHFVGELLEYTKAGRGSKQLKPINLSHVLAQVLDNTKTAVRAAEAEVSVDHSLPIVLGDHLALVQLFQNLLTNSLKFVSSDSKPKVSISASTNQEDIESGYIQVDVADNGIGVKPADKKRIFSPLVRVSRDQRIEGTGLGLSIAKKIVSQHDGYLKVESVFGKGSVFSVGLKQA